MADGGRAQRGDERFEAKIMKAKQVFKFLALAPAFSNRNLTSLGLVGVFMVVYVLAGGRISVMPNIRAGSSFGGLATEANSPAVSGDVVIDEQIPDEVVEVVEEEPVYDEPIYDDPVENAGAGGGLDDIASRLKNLDD